MSRYSYEIGTTAENLVNVETLLASGNKANGVRGMGLEPFSVYRTAVSGREYGDGYPHTTWEIDYLTPTMYNALMAYVGAGNQSAPVYIRTRKEDGTYGLYTAIMHRPKLRAERVWSGFWTNVSIHFTRLEEIEEEE